MTGYLRVRGWRLQVSVFMGLRGGLSFKRYAINKSAGPGAKRAPARAFNLQLGWLYIHGWKEVQ